MELAPEAVIIEKVEPAEEDGGEEGTEEGGEGTEGGEEGTDGLRRL